MDEYWTEQMTELHWAHLTEPMTETPTEIGLEAAKESDLVILMGWSSATMTAHKKEHKKESRLVCELAICWDPQSDYSYRLILWVWMSQALVLVFRTVGYSVNY